MTDATVVITIDGTSGVGKGTLGQALQRWTGFHFLDSGALYRLLGWWWSQTSLAVDATTVANQAAALPVEFVDGRIWFTLATGERLDVTQRIRTDAVAAAASQVAVVPANRTALLDFQRQAAKAPGLIADGRDMGTVIFPHADAKFFLQASAQVRAKRRYDQYMQQGVCADYDAILAQIQERDHRDATRSVAPAMPAVDAVVIDTSDLTAEQVFTKVKQTILDNGRIPRF